MNTFTIPSQTGAFCAGEKDSTEVKERETEMRDIPPTPCVLISKLDEIIAALHELKKKKRDKKEKSPCTPLKEEESKEQEALSNAGARGKFVPPTIEEVRAYCRERSNGVDPETWWNFYQAKGWMVGKTKMKDWHAAVHTWEKRRKEPEGPRRASFVRKADNWRGTDPKDIEDVF